MFITRTARVVLFSVMYVCVSVSLSVNVITPEPLEITKSSYDDKKGRQVRRFKPRKVKSLDRFTQDLCSMSEVGKIVEHG